MLIAGSDEDPGFSVGKISGKFYALRLGFRQVKGLKQEACSFLLTFVRIMKSLRTKHVVFIIAAIIIVDQALKLWIKTSHPTGEVVRVLGMDSRT